MTISGEVSFLRPKGSSVFLKFYYIEALNTAPNVL